MKRKAKNILSLTVAWLVILVTLYGIVRAYDFVIFEMDEREYVANYGPTIGPFVHEGDLDYFGVENSYLEETHYNIELFSARSREILNRKYPDNKMTAVLVYLADSLGNYQELCVVYDVSYIRLPWFHFRSLKGGVSFQVKRYPYQWSVSSRVRLLPKEWYSVNPLNGEIRNPIDYTITNKVVQAYMDQIDETHTFNEENGDYLLFEAQCVSIYLNNELIGTYDPPA